MKKKKSVIPQAILKRFESNFYHFY